MSFRGRWVVREFGYGRASSAAAFAARGEKSADAFSAHRWNGKSQAGRVGL
jgi:hypothetical protein